MNNHNFRRTVLLCFSLIVFSLKSYAQQAHFIFDYITNNNGLTNNTVYDICQDNKGFMWFATANGLNRFDGQNIKQYFHTSNDKHSLPTSNAVSLVYTPDSILFIGTTSTLVRYKQETDNFEQINFSNTILPTTFTFLSLKNGFKNELLIAAGKKGAYIYNYVKKSTTKFNLNSPIFGITCDQLSTYWLFSRNTLFRFDRNGKQIEKYLVSQNLFGSPISYITTDKNGRVWVGTFENGIYVFNNQNKTFEQLPACKNTKMYYVRTIEESETPGEYWVGAESGLYIINTNKNECKHYMQSFDHKGQTINDNAVYKILRNKQEIYFIGTFFGGVNIAKKKHIGFNAILPEDKPGKLHGKAISIIAKANNGNLWMATEDAGIAIFDKNKLTFSHLLFNENNPASISSNNVHSLLMDGNYCWAGLFMGGICKINIQTGGVKRYLNQAGNPASINNNFVFALHNLSPDSILVGTHSGVELFDKKTEIFSRFRENEFADSHILEIFTAPDGKVWFCTKNKGIFILDKNKKGLMTHYQMSDRSGLSSNTIISYCIDSKKQIWIGTLNGGLLKYIGNKQIFKSCNPHMLVDNIIYGIIEDKKKFLWISTNKGISRLNFKDSTAIHFTNKHGLAGNQHNYKSYFIDNNIIYFGGVMGLTWFNPETISIPREKPIIYFSNLRVFNKIIYPGSTILDKQIDFTTNIILRHYQNSFTLDYSSINFHTSDIVYQYYLEGFDEAWSPWLNLKQTNYTKLEPGNYIFHVRAMNTINGLISDERMLTIKVTPPLWASWYAYLFYIVLIGGFGYYIYRNYRTRQNEKMALNMEKTEKENLKLLHQHKMNFFTYISHEFKTPLSIIIASLEMLSQKQNTEDKDIIQSIKQSSTRLLALVNQLMEFRRIETDHAEIQLTRGNIFDFSNQIISNYRPLFDKKNIALSFKVQCAETDLDFDFDKLEKIITNLITNAIKCTPQNGTIDIDLQTNSKNLCISVKNSGDGISDNKKDKIFEVFYSDVISNEIVESSGIGLALTASLVKLLNGQITVETEPKEATKFVVSIPHPDKNYSSDVPTSLFNSVSNNMEVFNNDTSLESDTGLANKEFRLVIAEDNTDLLMLLNKNFRKKYQVKCFENGLDALDYITKKIPDVIITDIMMPVMDGIELCKRVKTNVNLCHIPILMLTAKDATEAKLEGLHAGADIYITKPFSMSELDVILTNLLNNQKALKKRLKELAGIEGFDIPTTNLEQAFIEKILAVIQNNLVQNNLDVQFVADELNISRSTLHNKMKNLMNMNTSEFINTVRINKAKELMLAKDLTYSEIAYKVGYKEATYFFRIFKKHTGMSPGEYQQIIAQKNKFKNTTLEVK